MCEAGSKRGGAERVAHRDVTLNISKASVLFLCSSWPPAKKARSPQDVAAMVARGTLSCAAPTRFPAASNISIAACIARHQIDDTDREHLGWS